MQNFYDFFFTVALLLHSKNKKKKFKWLMHECQNQITTWYKNKQKKKIKKNNPKQPRMTNHKNRKLAENTDYFFFLLLYDNWRVL